MKLLLALCLGLVAAMDDGGGEGEPHEGYEHGYGQKGHVDVDKHTGKATIEVPVGGYTVTREYGGYHKGKVHEGTKIHYGESYVCQRNKEGYGDLTCDDNAGGDFECTFNSGHGKGKGYYASGLYNNYGGSGHGHGHGHGGGHGHGVYGVYGGYGGHGGHGHGYASGYGYGQPSNYQLHYGAQKPAFGKPTFDGPNGITSKDGGRRKKRSADGSYERSYSFHGHGHGGYGGYGRGYGGYGGYGHGGYGGYGGYGYGQGGYGGYGHGGYGGYGYGGGYGRGGYGGGYGGYGRGGYGGYGHGGYGGYGHGGYGGYGYGGHGHGKGKAGYEDTTACWNKDTHKTLTCHHVYGYAWKCTERGTKVEGHYAVETQPAYYGNPYARYNNHGGHYRGGYGGGYGYH